MRRSTSNAIIIALMFLSISLYFISQAYARYSTISSGNATASVAKWDVSLKDKDDAVIQVQDLEFVVQSNNNVLNGRIAPSVTAIATVKIDLSGTEVAAQYKASINKTAIATVFGASANNVTVSVNGATENTFIDATGFNTSTGYSGSNAVKTIEISIEWDNNSDAQSSSDTIVGTTQNSIILPVTLTVQQKI